MMMIMLAVGLVLLVVGADVLVKGASRLAVAVGISPLVIGLTIVAFGTSAPEMAVSVGAAWSNAADLALGNVVGSNIFNVLFILGISAIIAPLAVAQQLIRLDVPLMIAVSIVVWLMALDGRIGHLDGLLLFAGILGYTLFLILHSRKEKNPAVIAEYEREFGATPQKPSNPWTNAALILGGLALLVIGSQLLVKGAVQIAQHLGVSELVIGLTIVAAGTSLPEVATSVIASLRGERDIAVGNVVGSNLFNLMAVLGLSGAVSPEGLPVPASALALDIPVMVGVAVLCLPIFFTGYVISRSEGAVFLFFFIAYTFYVVLSASQAAILTPYSNIMLKIVVPAVGFYLLTLALRYFFEGE
ncbi:MAG: calcium/sodium antiporter [Pseudomonadota bacterium]|nr:calcium/sodium antiporter [Pseudomonadota bacterium]